MSPKDPSIVSSDVINYISDFNFSGDSSHAPWKTPTPHFCRPRHATPHFLRHIPPIVQILLSVILRLQNAGSVIQRLIVPV